MSQYADRLKRISDRLDANRADASLTNEQRKQVVTDVLMANVTVGTYLYSQWDDGAEVGALADEILAALGAL